MSAVDLDRMTFTGVGSRSNVCLCVAGRFNRGTLLVN